jgi:outer membrane immunogenic protein
MNHRVMPRLIPIVISLMLVPLPAFAQAPPPPPAAFSWTGFYFGGSVNHNWTNAATAFEPLPSAAAFGHLMPTTLHPDPSGPNYQLTGGRNWQRHGLVLGGEAGFTWFNPDGSADVTPIIQNDGTPFPGGGALHAGMTTDWIATARARAGVAWHRVLVFGAGGLAIGSVDYYAEADYQPSGATYRSDGYTTKVGWTAGGGAEVRLGAHVGVVGEFKYLDLGSESRTVDATPPQPPYQLAFTWQTKITSIGVGVVIHF